MNTNISIFTNDQELQLNFKIEWDSLTSDYPVLSFKSGCDSLTIYPSLEQVYELQRAINKLVVEMENKDEVR